MKKTQENQSLEIKESRIFKKYEIYLFLKLLQIF